MKVRVAQVVVGLLSIAWATAQAPYPPSGYRPSGRQFALPSNPNQKQGLGGGVQLHSQLGPPQNPANQYGAPARRPQVTETPPDQYLPGLEPTDVRYLGGQQDSFLGGQGNQQVNPQQQTYLGPQVQPSGFSQNNQQQYSDRTQQQGRQQNYLGPDQQQTYIGQGQAEQQQQGWSENSQQPQTYSNQNQQGWNQPLAPNQNKGFEARQNSGVASLNRNYLTPQQNQQDRNQQNQNVGQRQSARQLYQNNGETDEDNVTNSEDEDLLGNNDQRQNYLPPTTTEGYVAKPTQRRRYPEPTTRRPEAEEPIEPESDEPEDPNVAIATAVARGQYYLLQPDGRLQRVMYRTTQTQEDVQNSGFSAKLIYQDVQPITGPIYSYTAPLLRIN